MPSNFTANYNLSQWERTDKVQMEDFNADNAKIDTALKAESDARTAADAALQTALAKKGNCSISLSTYTGTGTFGQDHPTRITFPKMPAAYFVFGDGILMGRGGSNQASIIFRTNGTGMYVIKVAWSGNTLSFSSTPAASQLNVPDTEYVVLGLYAES